VKDEYQNRELQSEVRRSHRFRLRDEALAAQHLAIAGIIAVLHGIAWSDEREATSVAFRPGAFGQAVCGNIVGTITDSSGANA